MREVRIVKRTTAGSSLLLLSCGPGEGRSGLLASLEALQRPFDLDGVTWLGIPAELPAHLLLSAFLAVVVAWLWRPRGAVVLIGSLIVLKEGLDLAIICLYEPLRWTYLSDSLLDVVVSFAGIAIGLLGVARMRRDGWGGEGGSGSPPLSRL